jgi:very-short-patch-repair endonuclease
VARESVPIPRIDTRIAGPEVDFAWPGLVVEIDGPGHARPRTRAQDRERDAILKAAGHRVMRIARDGLG